MGWLEKVKQTAQRAAEEVVAEGLEAAKAAIGEMIDFQQEFVALADVQPRPWTPRPSCAGSGTRRSGGAYGSTSGRRRGRSAPDPPASRSGRREARCGPSGRSSPSAPTARRSRGSGGSCSRSTPR